MVTCSTITCSWRAVSRMCMMLSSETQMRGEGLPTNYTQSSDDSIHVDADHAGQRGEERGGEESWRRRDWYQIPHITTHMNMWLKNRIPRNTRRSLPSLNAQKHTRYSLALSFPPPILHDQYSGTTLHKSRTVQLVYSVELCLR